MFTEMSRFSTRTVAAVSDLRDRSLYKSKDQYKWRKDMDEYEKSADFEKEVRIRNIENRQKKRREKQIEEDRIEEQERKAKLKAREEARAARQQEKEAMEAKLADLNKRQETFQKRRERQKQQEEEDEREHQAKMKARAEAKAARQKEKAAMEAKLAELDVSAAKSAKRMTNETESAAPVTQRFVCGQQLIIFHYYVAIAV